MSENTLDIANLIDALEARYGNAVVRNLYDRLHQHYDPPSKRQVSLIGGGYLDTRTHRFHWNRYWKRYGA